MPGRYAKPKPPKAPPDPNRNRGGRPRLTVEQVAAALVKRNEAAQARRQITRQVMNAVRVAQSGGTVPDDAPRLPVLTIPPPPSAAGIAPGAPPVERPNFKDAVAYAMFMINAPDVAEEHKIRLAVAVMPFQTAKLADKAPGKKEQRQLDAAVAGRGTDWDDLLDTPASPNSKASATSSDRRH